MRMNLNECKQEILRLCIEEEINKEHRLQKNIAMTMAIIVSMIVEIIVSIIDLLITPAILITFNVKIAWMIFNILTLIGICVYRRYIINGSLITQCKILYTILYTYYIDPNGIDNKAAISIVKEVYNETIEIINFQSISNMN